MRECDCGSGAVVLDVIRDGYGIYLFSCCDKCYDKKMKRYRPDINTRYEADEPIDENE